MNDVEKSATPEKIKRSFPPFLRAFAAIFFAALLTSLIISGLLFGLISWLDSISSRPLAMKTIPVFWILFPVILVFTALFGLIVEWPKSRWLIRRKTSGKWIGILVSAALAMTIGTLQSMAVMPTVSSPIAAYYGNLMNMFIGLLIGASSGLFWWRYIIAPARQKYSAPVIAAQFE